MKQISILLLMTSMMLFSCSKEELASESPENVYRSVLSKIDKKIIYKDSASQYTASAVSGVDELLRGSENATWLLTANGDFKMSISIDAKNLKNGQNIDIMSDWETKENIHMNFKGEDYYTRDMTIEPTKMGSITIDEYNGRAIKGSFSCTMRTRKGKCKEFKNIQFSSEVVKY